MDPTRHVPGFRAILDLDHDARTPAVLAARDGTGELVVVRHLAAADLPVGVARLIGLRGPHLVALLDVVEIASGVAVVTELVDGVSLAATLERHGPLEPESTLCLLTDVLRAVAAVRGQGIEGRDATVPDVLVTAEGTVRLAAHRACGADLRVLLAECGGGPAGLPSALRMLDQDPASRIDPIAYACYGADWEERGRRGLRRRAALLAGLSPTARRASARLVAAGST